jgi:EAL domain-containing protein (putative c-di-GMP-specific phosphodiesterase class I)
MSLTVIAEGVETAEQLKFLQAQRCDAVQGYLLYRPLPEAEVADTIRADWESRSARFAMNA